MDLHRLFRFRPAPALGARQTVFRQNTQAPFWQFCQFKGTQFSSLVSWPISDIFLNARKNEDSCKNRFARDARQRRADVARRRRGWRSIAHTVSPCGSANRCCVWSTDAAHLASIVCRQPPKRGEKNEDWCRKRIAQDARQRRVDVARRRRGWRSIAQTVSTCGSAIRCCVWSTDAAHLASIVCRQPPKKSSQDRSKPLWTRRATVASQK